MLKDHRLSKERCPDDFRQTVSLSFACVFDPIPAFGAHRAEVALQRKDEMRDGRDLREPDFQHFVDWVAVLRGFDGVEVRGFSA